MDALGVYKALGDDTRFAIYQELAQSSSPLSAAALAERLGLHPNTIRPHLDRMRDAGVVEVEAIHRGTVGRPQFQYSLAPGAPGLGLDPPAHTLLAGLLAALCEGLGAETVDAAELGRHWGGEAVARHPGAGGCLAALTGELERLGFDPASEDLGEKGDHGDRVRVAFLHCPFRELAEAYPELVCHLHRGIVEGVVEAAAGQGIVEHFATLADRDPCHVDVALGYAS